MRRSALAAFVLAVVACSRPSVPLPPFRVPLSEYAAAARAETETDALDIGAPSGRAALWSGWGPNEKSPVGSFAWGGDAGSRIRLEVVEPRTRRLTLEGWSYPFGDDPPQEVTLQLNGHEVARRVLSPRPGSFEVLIPERFWRPGENFLDLAYRRHDEKTGEHPWAAAWASLRFADARSEETRPPRFEPQRGEFVLPARTAMDWALELPGGSWLAWDRLETTGTARLLITVRDGDSTHSHQMARSGGRVRLTPDGAPHRIVDFSLRAVGKTGVVRVRDARLHLPLEPHGNPTGGSAAPGSAATQPNIVVYLIDALRADHLGCYGYSRPTSPAIDRFAAGATRWIEGRAQASWTRPAVATILTGLYPITHRVERVHDRLPKHFETAAERLAAAGYESAMFTTNGNTSAQFGFDQGWSTFVYLHERRRTPELHVQSPELNRKAIEWLDRRDRGKPFFLFLHSTDPHDPYTPRASTIKKVIGEPVDRSLGLTAAIDQLESLTPAQARARRHDLVALYDSEIAQNDASFGELLRALSHRHLDRSTAILLLADHGEEFLDHGRWRHGWTLYDEVLRVPMILRLPGGEGRGLVLPGPAEEIDVVPTLMDLAGLPPSEKLPGRSLLPEIRGRRPPIRSSFAWLHRPNIALASVEREQWKLIRNDVDWLPPLGKPPFELYALGSDPAEHRDLAVERPIRWLWLQGQLGDVFARFGSHAQAEKTELDPELEKALRALGYL